MALEVACFRHSTRRMTDNTRIQEARKYIFKTRIHSGVVKRSIKEVREKRRKRDERQKETGRRSKKRRETERMKRDGRGDDERRRNTVRCGRSRAEAEQKSRRAEAEKARPARTLIRSRILCQYLGGITAPGRTRITRGLAVWAVVLVRDEVEEAVIVGAVFIAASVDLHRILALAPTSVRPVLGAHFRRPDLGVAALPALAGVFLPAVFLRRHSGFVLLRLGRGGRVIVGVSVGVW